MRKSEKRVKSSSRRNFLKGVTAISVAGINSHSSSANGMENESLASAPAASQSQKDKKLIAIQVGAVSFVDEGVDKNQPQIKPIYQSRTEVGEFAGRRALARNRTPPIKVSGRNWRRTAAEFQEHRSHFLISFIVFDLAFLSPFKTFLSSFKSFLSSFKSSRSSFLIPFIVFDPAFMSSFKSSLSSFKSSGSSFLIPFIVFDLAFLSSFKSSGSSFLIPFIVFDLASLSSFKSSGSSFLIPFIVFDLAFLSSFKSSRSSFLIPFIVFDPVFL